ncbi:MAG: 30S ribosomal protein S6 [Clostridiales bacterium]|jgi:small subunit ribosomal protein S6|nr:30S ribosomal protein S6 [Clostridiales bacterium]
MNKYESVYVINASIGDEAINGKVAKFNELIATNGGNVTKVDEWGKRRLAYPIDYVTEGYYVLINFEGDSELPKELERNFRIDESVIRFVVIRVDE